MRISYQTCSSFFECCTFCIKGVVGSCSFRFEKALRFGNVKVSFQKGNFVVWEHQGFVSKRKLCGFGTSRSIVIILAPFTIIIIIIISAGGEQNELYAYVGRSPNSCVRYELFCWLSFVFSVFVVSNEHFCLNDCYDASFVLYGLP